jgi:hypothetical protein
MLWHLSECTQNSVTHDLLTNISSGVPIRAVSNRSSQYLIGCRNDDGVNLRLRGRLSISLRPLMALVKRATDLVASVPGSPQEEALVAIADTPEPDEARRWANSAARLQIRGTDGLGSASRRIRPRFKDKERALARGPLSSWRVNCACRISNIVSRSPMISERELAARGSGRCWIVEVEATKGEARSKAIKLTGVQAITLAWLHFKVCPIAFGTPRVRGTFARAYARFFIEH